MYNRKLALSLAKQYRTCPPRHIRNDPVHRKRVLEHIGMCPYCSSGVIPKISTAWEDLADRLADTLDLSDSSAKVVKPERGMLCPVKDELAGWRQGRFYNPPIVLILDIPGNISDDILVAQTYHDIAMAGPGDLILTETETGFVGLFPESWNTYTLKSSYLALPVGRVRPEIGDVCARLGQDPEAYPPWSVQPRPMVNDDARLYFRELEIEVGYTFSAQAVEQLMTEFEDPGLELDYSSPEALQKTIGNKVQGIQWPRQPESVCEVICLARFPEESLALAADITGREIQTAAIALIRNGKVKSFDPATVEIYKKEISSGKVTVSGRILDTPTEFLESRLVCFLTVGEDRLVLPEKSKWDDREGFFLAEFDSKTRGDVEIAIGVVFFME